MKPDNANPNPQLEPSNSLDLPKPTATNTSSTRAASTDILALIERNRIQSLRRKQRADSFLNKLTDSQLAQVLEWFEDEHNIAVVHYHITSPAPKGLGLQVDLSTLRRLRAHITATHSNARTTEILDTLLDMETAGDLSQSERIQSAINQLLHQKAFELVRTEPGSVELRDILHTIERLSALDLKRQKIELEREKLIFRTQQSSTPPRARQHKIELKIVPSTPATEPTLPSHSSHNSPQLEIIAPLPEVIL